MPIREPSVEKGCSRNAIRQVDRVAIVDPRPDDYRELAAIHSTRELQFQFAVTGDDALKLPRTNGRSIWLVNLRLPDGNGCDLAEAIRARDLQSIIYLVADEYDPTEELKARKVGGVMYVVKPLQSEWLSIATRPPSPLPQRI